MAGRYQPPIRGSACQRKIQGHPVKRVYDAGMAKAKKQKPGPKPERGETAGFVGLRLTPTERDAYEEAAEAEGMKLSQWIRAACDARLKRAKK